VHPLVHIYSRPKHRCLRSGNGREHVKGGACLPSVRYRLLGMGQCTGGLGMGGSAQLALTHYALGSILLQALVGVLQLPHNLDGPEGSPVLACTRREGQASKEWGDLERRHCAGKSHLSRDTPGRLTPLSVRVLVWHDSFTRWQPCRRPFPISSGVLVRRVMALGTCDAQGRFPDCRARKDASRWTTDIGIAWLCHRLQV
jgi:hypothetical protein